MQLQLLFQIFHAGLVLFRPRFAAQTQQMLALYYDGDVYMLAAVCIQDWICMTASDVVVFSDAVVPSDVVVYDFVEACTLALLV